MGVLAELGEASAWGATASQEFGVILPSAPLTERGSSTGLRMAFRMVPFRVIGFGCLTICTNVQIKWACQQSPLGVCRWMGPASVAGPALNPSSLKARA